MERKLVRKNKKLFGVCGGLGDYFGIDPTIIRIVFVVAAIGYGTGVLLYLILALVVPEEKPGF
jgi:phage shock protein C